MPRPSDVVVTIHGINSDGEWQKDVERYLSPYFICVALKYDEFQRFGVLKQLLGARARWIAPLLVAAAAAYAFGSMALGVLVAVLVCALMIRQSGVLRQQAATKACAQCRALTAAAPRRHLIAHSFGTFVSATLLERSDGMPFDHVIFTAAVLPTNHDWSPLLHRKPPAFRTLRNEMGVFDRVPAAINWLERAGIRWMPFGMSGKHGFSGPSHIVHELDHPNAGCAVCCAAEPDSLHRGVHNVKLNLNHHEFLSAPHYLWFWLPTLFDLEPGEFRDFHSKCIAANQAEINQDRIGTSRAIEALRTSTWRWCGGDFDSFLLRSIEVAFAYKEKALPTQNELRDLSARALRLVWKSVHRATEPWQRGSQPSGAGAWRFLPKYAVLSAANIVMLRHSNG